MSEIEEIEYKKEKKEEVLDNGKSSDTTVIIVFVMTFILILLKSLGYINISWWVVFSFVWIPILIVFLLLILFFGGLL